MAFIWVCWRISDVRLPAKARNPPLQSGAVPGDWPITSAALVYKKDLRGQLEGHELVISVLWTTDCWDQFPPLAHCMEVCNEEQRCWACWNASLLRRSQHVFWKGRSCPIYCWRAVRMMDEGSSAVILYVYMGMYAFKQLHLTKLCTEN